MIRIFWTLVALLVLAAAFVIPWSGDSESEVPDTAAAPAPPASGVTPPNRRERPAPAMPDLEPTGDDDRTLGAPAEDDPVLDDTLAEAEAELGVTPPEDPVGSMGNIQAALGLAGLPTPLPGVQVRALAEPTIGRRSGGGSLLARTAATLSDLEGSGTPEDPYRITWDTLLLSSHTYKPRDGKDEFPPIIEQLDGQHVRVAGYFIFPQFVGETQEALVMYNQWDGCCLGVPPSVYDSIEVRFDEPVQLNRGHFALFGTFEGVLKVDPYLVNEWLIGLYLLEEASVRVSL